MWSGRPELVGQSALAGVHRPLRQRDRKRALIDMNVTLENLGQLEKDGAGRGLSALNSPRLNGSLGVAKPSDK